jgi:broad specificity phosphatase PhoE
VTTRLVLICCAATATARTGGFAAPDEPVDEGGRRKAAVLRAAGPATISPARAARETADALGIVATPDARLRDQNHGDWTGQSFAAVAATSPEALNRWLAAPERGAPGGEPLEAVCTRAGGWLDEQRDRGGSVLAITHPMVIRAITACALTIAPEATLGIDIPPLCRVVLSCHGRWRLQAIEPAT